MDPEINPPLKISLFSKTPDLPASEKEVVGNVRSNHERAESFWWRPQTWPGLEQLTPTAVFKRLLNTPSNWSFQETSSSSWGPGRTVYLNSDLVWNSWHQKDPQAAAAVFNRVTHPAIQDTVTDAPWNTDTKQLTPQPQWHTLQYRLVFFDDDPNIARNWWTWRDMDPRERNGKDLNHVGTVNRSPCTGLDIVMGVDCPWTGCHQWLSWMNWLNWVNWET